MKKTIFSFLTNSLLNSIYDKWHLEFSFADFAEKIRTSDFECTMSCISVNPPYPYCYDLAVCAYEGKELDFSKSYYYDFYKLTNDSIDLECIIYYDEYTYENVGIVIYET